jgi:hypothetical protein
VSGDVRLERIGVAMENDLAAIAIASRAVWHASEPRYRAEDLIYEAWEAAGPRRACARSQGARAVA